MDHINKCQHTALEAFGNAERLVKATRHDIDRRKAEVAMLEAGEELDRIERAKDCMQSSYLGQFVKCLSCGNPFSDQYSYLAHWRYRSGRICCEFTPSILKSMGFVADRYEHGDGSEVYVLRQNQPG